MTAHASLAGKSLAAVITLSLAAIALFAAYELIVIILPILMTWGYQNITQNH